MTLDQQIQLTEIFLIANSILAVALADAGNEKLKTGLSIAGLVISFSWCVINLSSSLQPTIRPAVIGNVLATLAVLAALGWLFSTVIHALKWRGKR